MFRAKSLDAAEADLRAAASRDVGDWFRFELGARRPIGEGSPGGRYQVRAYVGAAIWAEFRVDLVGPEVAMIGEPEAVAAIAPLGLPEVPQGGYRAYPLVDHVADKVVATFDRYGSQRLPSTR